MVSDESLGRDRMYVRPVTILCIDFIIILSIESVSRV